MKELKWGFTGHPGFEIRAIERFLVNGTNHYQEKHLGVKMYLHSKDIEGIYIESNADGIQIKGYLPKKELYKMFPQKEHLVYKRLHPG